MSVDPNISILLDIYGNILTNRQQEYLDLYYNQDLSLSEIAEQYNISRQGVRDSIEHGKSCLYKLETKLNLVNKLINIHNNCNKIISLSNLIIKNSNSNGDFITISKYAKQINVISNKILNS